MPEPVAEAPGGGQGASPLGGAGLPEIKGFLETSFLDWRGKISAVLFLPGCNFACPYCHNHTLAARPQELASLPLDQIMTRLKPFVGWIDGVVISGGEPTLHPGLPRLLEMVRRAGFSVKLDTNGYRPEVLAYLHRHGLVDYVAMDLKAPLEPLAYRRVSGRKVDVDQVRASLEFLKASGLAHEVRSTIWPGWHGPEELRAMAQAVRGAQAWTLQALNPDSAWNREALGPGRPYDAETLARLQAQWADPVVSA